MTTLLEESYRWWLRLLPAWYRLGREEEMAATFLEAAGSGEDAEIARPSWAEIRGVLALAVRTRLGGAGAVPRACAWGDGARVFALAAVLMQAVLATIPAWGALHGYILASAAQRRGWTAMSGTPTPRDLELWLAPTVWIVVYLAVVLGRWRAARWFALAADASPAPTRPVCAPYPSQDLTDARDAEPAGRMRRIPGPSARLVCNPPSQAPSGQARASPRRSSVLTPGAGTSRLRGSHRGRPSHGNG